MAGGTARPAAAEGEAGHEPEEQAGAQRNILAPVQRHLNVMDASSSDSATASDSVFASAEFQEYEREFRQYCADNLRSHNPQTDFDSIRRDSAEDLAAKLAVLSQWWRSAAHVAGKLALVATTNDDSLHGKAGLPKHALVELHGNLFVE
ncbi:hypothetical protein EMIHUDRAFT_251401, partial [Emiliania huxleyi CCMP1516]|uniref:Deacetylase sirtuin-type domain-containing protein n=2 Tax=Emiliania huxleyi TaxID=2903 RepID=A0A0D3KVG3_EMIH1